MNGSGIVSGSPMATDSGGDAISDNDFVTVVNSHTTIVNTLNDKELMMPERLSPDGADEGDELQITNEQTEFDDDAWSDWETEKQSDEHQQAEEKPTADINGDAFENKDETSTIVTPNYQRNISISSSNSTSTHTNNNNQNNDSLIKDIKDIEIKPANNNHLDSEIDDLFKDMEPVIEIPNSIASLLSSPQFNQNPIIKDSPQKNVKNENKIDKNRFAMTVSVDDDNVDDAAWGDGANDWDN